MAAGTAHAAPSLWSAFGEARPRSITAGLGGCGADDAERAVAEEVAASVSKRRRVAPANRNRGSLPAHLPRYEVIIDIESKDCPCCGGGFCQRSRQASAGPQM